MSYTIAQKNVLKGLTLDGVIGLLTYRADEW